MARKLKTKTVNKFGGTEKLGDVKFQGGDKYEVSSLEARATTKITEDVGHGTAVVIRQFEFGINPLVWQQKPPSKQDLFNYHLKGIEMALWRDGLKPYTESEPRIVVSSEKMNYKIIVPCVPMRGHQLRERPLTLTEIASS